MTELAGRTPMSEAESSKALPSPEGIIRRDHIAMMLSENGPYSVTRNPLKTYLSSPVSVRRQFRADLATIGNLIGADGLSNIRTALDSGQISSRKHHQVNKKIADIYDTDAKKESSREAKIRSYASIADAFINSYMRTGVWEPLSQRTDLIEEVQSTDDVLDLLGFIFKPGYDARIKFEARRKLVLMSLAASIDARSGELREHDRYPEFINFLNTHIWHREASEKTGTTRKVTLLSQHDPDTYECTEVKELTTQDERQKEIDKIDRHRYKKGENYPRLTTFDQRHIMHKGELIPVFQDSRQKNLMSRMAKMIRKGEEDPAVAVPDTTGLMMVVRNNVDAYKLLKHIASGGDDKSSLIKIEDLEDTLSGQEYSATNEGSSKKTSQLKLIARQKGMSIEVIIHTYKTYLNNLYADDVAHEEFQVNRLVNSGTFELLFPRAIYGIPPDSTRKIIKHQRALRRKGSPQI